MPSPDPTPPSVAPWVRVGTRIGRLGGGLLAWLCRLAIGPETISPRRPPADLRTLPRHLRRDIGIDRDHC